MAVRDANDMTDVGRGRRWAGRGLSFALLAGLLSACLPPADAPPDPAGCVSSTELFERRVWPEVVSRCASCHVPGGAAAGSRLLLRPAEAPGALGYNYEVFGQAATTLLDGDTPLVLRKPTGLVPHGGGQVLEPEGPEVALLRQMIDQYRRPVACDTQVVPPPGDPAEGVTLLDPAATLRKASLQLAGRVPTDAELAAARRGGLDALDPILLSMMGERAFLDRIKEIFNDVFLTDANLFYRVYDSLTNKALDKRAFPTWNWYGSPDSDAGRLTLDALAREPLEMVAYVVKNDRPATEIVTGRYRLVNPYTARVFGLRPTFKDPSDLSEFVEVQLPQIHDYAPGQGEYAGVLTTTSFLFRYPNTETNRNRKRARYFYQHFLGFDIMQSAPRIDLSTIDFSADPWRKNPVCTGCHASLDPVAGAFQNWTNCYSGQGIRYYKPGERFCQGAWYPDATMFPPGTGAGQTLPRERLPTALEALAATVVGNPGFGKAMAGHLLRGLLGRPLLLPPTDPSAPTYAGLAAAYDAQQKLLAALSEQFAKSNYNLKRLVIAIVKSPAFRAANAEREGRLELTGVGGGALTAPEVLHRKIQSVLGYPWGTAGSLNNRSTIGTPYYLLGPDRLRVLYGGIDSVTVTTRQQLPGGLSAAASQRMASEMACEYAAVDLAAPRASRRLFPYVDRDRVPGGDASAASEADVLKTLQHLHARILGEELDTSDPELRATYDLLVKAQRDGAAAIAAGRAARQLGARCRADYVYATGQAVSGGFSDDSNYMVRAWQAVLTYLLLDYKFLFE